MATFQQLSEEVLLRLESLSAEQAMVGTLTSSITNSATTFTSANTALSTGIMQIEDELVYVQNFDRTTGVATNVIRGWRGTTAAAHNAGSVVLSNPKYPLHLIKTAINTTINSLYPSAWAVSIEDILFENTKYIYQLPANVRGVVSVNVLHPTTEDYGYTPLREWKFNPAPGGTNDGYTAIEFAEIVPNADVRVICRTEPAPLVSASDEFTTVTGLPEYVKETVILGTLWRVFSSVDVGRIAVNSADQTLLSAAAPVGKGTDISKYLLGQYQQSLDEVARRLHLQYPISGNFTW